MGLRDTGAPRTVPHTFRSALAFFEKGAGFAGDQRLSEHSPYRASLPPLQGPGQPANQEEGCGGRGHGAPGAGQRGGGTWINLFKLWTASRTDDLTGINPTSLKMGQGLLAGKGPSLLRGLRGLDASGAEPSEAMRVWSGQVLLRGGLLTAPGHGHSERNWLVSVAATLGVSREVVGRVCEVGVPGDSEHL